MGALASGKGSGTIELTGDWVWVWAWGDTAATKARRAAATLCTDIYIGNTLVWRLILFAE